MIRLLTILFCVVGLNAQNINYAKHNIHTQTPKSGNIQILGSYLKMNDTLDVLDIKESEFGTSTANYDSLGDMDGYEFELRYSISDTLMLDYTRTNENISYGENVLNNNRDEIFLRYNFLNSKMSLINGLSIDIGYVKNRAKDIYIRDLDDINSMLDKVSTDEGVNYNIKIEPHPIVNPVYPYVINDYTNDPSNPTTLGNGLELSPYFSSENLSDESQYIRLLANITSSHLLTDFFIGYKKTKISTFVDSSLHYETDISLQNELDNRNITPYKRLDRDEEMAFFGVNISYDDTKYNMAYEFCYEYDMLFRDNGLDYRDYNHIIKANISKVIDKNLLLSVGGKIMMTQFSGQIPYLYNKYSQTSFDHKYGYMNIGLSYKFNIGE